MSNATLLFRETLASIPQDVTKQVDWSFAIADKIAARLKELDISPSQFARLVGETQSEISRWLSGTYNFSIGTLAKISAALGQNLIKI
ncbi:MAG TPA: helix-turn-helix transcriptional regulator [Candidatus Bacteroides merdigallinarum]|uniref:Helix-turn-helix transcriptional regulator n=1 Tax=Candidatus Bacteroides merdigallinarum TaxID=2838473 RepID=A0A9D2E8A7_9BACE|nr:helix-turn-helix transcriptional regulator [Candidatus Bacteroides merdigallinarum]